jgi:hypothetical protein
MGPVTLLETVRGGADVPGLHRTIDDSRYSGGAGRQLRRLPNADCTGSGRPTGSPSHRPRGSCERGPVAHACDGLRVFRAVLAELRSEVPIRSAPVGRRRSRGTRGEPDQTQRASHAMIVTAFQYPLSSVFESQSRCENASADRRADQRRALSDHKK